MHRVKGIRGLERFAEMRRRNGARAAARRVAYRLAQRLVDLKVGNVLWLDVANVNDSLPRDPAFTFRFLSADEVLAFSADADNWLHPAMADRIVAGNDFCFAALCRRRLAAFGWFALGCIEPEHNGGTALSYPPDVAYMYGGFTYHEFRGKRLHGLVKGLGLRALGEYGVRKLVSTVDWTNFASLRSNFRLGCVNLGLAMVLRVGRFRLARYPRAAKRLGICFDKDAMKRPVPVRLPGESEACSRWSRSSHDRSSGPGAATGAGPLAQEQSTHSFDPPLDAPTA